MAQNTVTIFISAAEVSGDHHAARLIRQFKRDGKNVRFIGLGGPEMQAAGCELIENLVARSAMLTHAVFQIAFYFKLIRRVKKILAAEKPDLVISVDSPAWNIHIARAAHKLNIPTMQYAAPQLWAWAPWRAAKWRRNADRIACILPFEPDWFARKNIKAEFVGHPLFDDRPEYIKPAVTEDHDAGDDNNAFTVALLPGSRKHEIQELWQPMLEIARRLREHFPDITFLSAAPDSETASQLKSMVPQDFNIEFCQQGLIEATARADLAIIASGTATLETAVAGCPMIVLYHVPAWQWHMVGKHILTIDHISLVNILAAKELVPEFVPFANRVKEVSETAAALLNNPAKLAKVKAELLELTKPIAQNKASINVAKIAYDLIGLK